MIKYLLFAALLAGSLVACTRERDACLQPKTVSLRAGCYRYADTGRAVVDSTLPNPLLIPLETLTQQGFYYGGRSAKLAFRLSQVADSTRYIIQPDSGVSETDTLTFFYNRQLTFISNACGYATYYNLQRVGWTTHFIDSVFITNPYISNDANVEHLRIRIGL